MGPTGGTGTSHLSPDLAKKVEAMMKANPALRVSSSYRDTHTQNKLRKGGGPIAPASRSAHTRGWAVDIGPTSQMGWLENNAHKFGLQTAANRGEPWHVQLAGSMPYGDFEIPNDADFLGSLKTFLDFFMSGSSQDFAKMTDKTTTAFASLMLAPFAGLLKMFGASDMFGKAQTGFMDVLNSESSAKIKIRVPKGFGGFSSSLATDPLFNMNTFADIGDPYGLTDLSSRQSSSVRMGSPVIFQSKITVNTTGGGTRTAAKATASAIADHLESELARRQWAVT